MVLLYMCKIAVPHKRREMKKQLEEERRKKESPASNEARDNSLDSYLSDETFDDYYTQIDRIIFLEIHYHYIYKIALAFLPRLFI